LGGALGELPTAEREGYVFVGWFKGQIEEHKLQYHQEIQRILQDGDTYLY